MKSLCILTIAMFLVKVGFACDCSGKPFIDIADWNDSEIIFTATLSQYENTSKVTILTFLISEVFKGKINKKEISYSLKREKASFYGVKMVEDHNNPFHHLDSIFIGQKWIVFSSRFEIKNESSYMLNKPRDDNYCMLSRPIKDNDSYLRFINKISQIANTTSKYFYKNNVAFAQGSLNNKIPVGKWKYFTRDDADHYWEGKYENGKREGKWVEKAINFKNEQVVINEEIYSLGILKEQIKYNYIKEIQEHKIYDEKTIKRTIYHKNTISSIWEYDKSLNTSTIEYFKNGKSINKIIKNGLVF